jgi:prefoldin subunit 5
MAATSKQNAIRDLDAAIAELREARQFVVNNRFESAENEIGDALRFIGRAIRQINKVERRINKNTLPIQ